MYKSCRNNLHDMSKFVCLFVFLYVFFLFSGKKKRKVAPVCPSELAKRVSGKDSVHNYENFYAYSSIQKILPPKNENCQIKKSDIFHISAQKQIVGTH